MNRPAVCLLFADRRFFALINEVGQINFDMLILKKNHVLLRFAINKHSVLLSNLRPCMKHLKAINKYFWKYRIRLGIGILFVFLSNYFNVLTPQVTGFVIDFVQKSLNLPGYQPRKGGPDYDPLVNQFIAKVRIV